MNRTWTLGTVVVCAACGGDAWQFRPLDAGATGADTTLAADDRGAAPIDTPTPSADQTTSSSTDVVRPADDGAVVVPLDATPSGPCYGRERDACCATSPPCMPGLACRSGTCELINDPPTCRQAPMPCTGTATSCCAGLRCDRERGMSNGSLVCCGDVGTRCYNDQYCCSRLLCVDGLCACAPRTRPCVTQNDCCSRNCVIAAGDVGQCM